MGSVVIVEVDETVVGERALPVGGPGADVGPFLDQDPMEALDAPMFVKPARVVR